MTAADRPRTSLRLDLRAAARDWYPDAALALGALAAAVAFIVLHVVDVRHDYAQESIRLGDVERYARRPGTHGLAQLVQALGMWWFLVTVAVLLCAALASRRRYARVVAVAVVTVSALGTVAVCKLLIRHPGIGTLLGRPIGSFPSGHTTDLTAVIGVALLVLLPIGWRWAAYAVAAAGGFVVGSTRVVSGTHTPDDVLTGWLLGLGFVLVAGTWLTARRTS
ncbi:MAG: phosphatase PAP2 family protein [Mycobacteriales bacterium]